MMYASAFTVSTLLSPDVLNPKDLQAVAMVATIPTILVAAPDKGYKSVADLVAAAKKKQGGIICSNAGTGSATHMNLERFRFSAGIEVISIPTKGVSEALTEVISGRADCTLPSCSGEAHGRRRQGGRPAHGSPSAARWCRSCRPRSNSVSPIRTTILVGALVPSRPACDVDRLHADITALVETPGDQARSVFRLRPHVGARFRGVDQGDGERRAHKARGN
jgi:hypothetical protein